MKNKDGDEDRLQALLGKMHKGITAKKAINIVVPDDNFVFGYTIGLMQNFVHPEILITGLPPERIDQFLKELKEKIEKGMTFKTETIYTDIAQGNFPAIFKKVDPINFTNYFGFALRYYGEYEPDLFPGFSVLQMIWCDKNSKFPWEQGYSLPQNYQPLFYEGAPKIIGDGH